MPKEQWPPEMGREAALAAAQRVAENIHVTEYRQIAEQRVREHGYGPFELQWKWRQDPPPYANTQEWHRECVSAILDALNHEGVVAWDGDGVGCVAQIVQAYALRTRATEPTIKTLNEEAKGEHCDLDYRPDPAQRVAGEDGKPFQRRVLDWMMECFSMEICRDGMERNHRFLEESLELVQSLGCTRSEAHQLVDYTFDRPAGDPKQELGGVMVTIAALCFPNELNMDEAAETELARVWSKIDIIRAKQEAKPKHSPLPAALALSPGKVEEPYYSYLHGPRCRECADFSENGICPHDGRRCDGRAPEEQG